MKKTILFYFIFLFAIISYAFPDEMMEEENNNPGEEFARKAYEIWLSEKYNDYPLAVSLFKKAISKDPYNSEYYSSLGRIYFEMNRLDDAFYLLDKALRLKPQKAWIEAWTYICLGEIYEKHHDYGSALRCYNRALKVNTTSNSNKEAFFRKRLVQWKHKESPHFIFYYPEGGIAERDINDIMKDYEKNYEKIIDFLNIKALNTPIQCYLFSSADKLWEMTGADCGFTRPHVRQIYTLYSTEMKENEPPARLIAYIISFSINKKINNEPFIQWGLAEFFTQEELKNKVIQLKKANKFIPLSSLRKGFYNYERDVALTESGSFVKFLIDAYGIYKFKTIWPAEDIDKALKELYKKSFKDLEKEWQIYLKKF